jgi:hypothetical protein
VSGKLLDLEVYRFPPEGRRRFKRKEEKGGKRRGREKERKREKGSPWSVSPIFIVCCNSAAK